MKKNILIIGLVIFVIFASVIILYRYTRPKGLVAFVIDDWGYNRKNIELVLEIERPLTISILPNLRYSDAIAESFRKNDIILHLPMESKSNMSAEKDTIRSNMGELEIISILNKDIAGLPGLVGISNHQGSKATEDERVMRIIMAELKKRGLFFLDSLTTPRSVCLDVAHDTGLRYAQRDVFLDITDKTDLRNFESYIKGQIQELANVAMIKGSAIGIGHNKRITLELIRDSIPELEEKGIRIVPLKRLVK